MKNLCIFIVGCFFTATLSGCIYIEPTRPGYGGYSSNYYDNGNLALAAARFNTTSVLLHSAGQSFYIPPTQVFTSRRADPCDGLTPFQCVGFDINKNVNDGRAGIGNFNHHNRNHDDHRNDGNRNRHGGNNHSSDDNNHRGDDGRRRGK